MNSQALIGSCERLPPLSLCISGRLTLVGSLGFISIDTLPPPSGGREPRRLSCIWDKSPLSRRLLDAHAACARSGK